jgi:hypothetical protein
MKDKVLSSLLFGVAVGHTNGIIEDDEMGAMLSALDIGVIAKKVIETQKHLNASTIVNVLDTEGNVLIAGQNYMLGDKKVKVLRETFGSGNFMDTYYRVWFLNSDLEESFEVIDASFPDGVFGKRVYKSMFVPIADEK